MRILGIILIIAGVAALAIGGITYSRKETVAEVGPLKVSAEKKRTIPVSPLVSGAVVVVGVVLVLAGARQRT